MHSQHLQKTLPQTASTDQEASCNLLFKQTLRGVFIFQRIKFHGHKAFTNNDLRKIIAYCGKHGRGKSLKSCLLLISIYVSVTQRIISFRATPPPA